MPAKRKNYQTDGLFFTLKGYIMVKNLLAKSGSLLYLPAYFRSARPDASAGAWGIGPGGQNGPRECLFRRKDMKENTFVHRLLRRALSLCLSLALTVSLCVPALAAQRTYSGNDYVQRLKDTVRESAVVDVDAGKDPNEVVRAMVVTDVPAAVEQAGNADYTAAVQSAESKTLRSQESIIRQARRITGNSVINQTGYLVSAFSMNMTRSQMKQVAALDGVVSVSEVTSYQARMTTAKDMTSAMELWKAENGGNTGEGIVVAVIDSGVNYSHPDMQMRQDAKLKYSQADMAEKIAALGYGRYYTDKVPFGCSYVGEEEIRNEMVTHGLHVSGIVAANGDQENGGVVGVAPDAQIFAMQVFGDTGSAYNDDIIRAVEDSVKLGADILNLSLGGTAGFYDDADYLQKALAYAEKNGVVVCVVAGNDGSSSADGADGDYNTNDWGVIDTGAVSSPATYPGALSVASVDNAYLRGKSVTISSGEDTVYSGVVTDFSKGNHTDWSSLGEVPILEFGYGDLLEDIFPKLSTLPDEPYVALVQRGKDISFEDKINYLMGMAHASAVIVYNNEATDQVPANVSAESASQYTAMMVSGSTGAKLMELTAAGAKVRFDGLKDVVYPNEATGGKVSTFSSWGSTPTLDIKPEISAPGGNILSVSRGEKYEEMSGTSMATPYVSGCAALVLESLQKSLAGGGLVLGDTSLNTFVKNTLMNTADPIYDGSVIFSVRQQGSGMIDPLSAAENRVLATYNGVASVALKEVGNTTGFTMTLTNYGTAVAGYTLPASVPVYTDVTGQDGSYAMELLSGASVTFDKTAVTVPAGGTVQVTGTLTIPANAAKNHYVEAFLPFDGDVDLSLPLMGFYGDWYGCQRIIDLPAWDDGNIMTDYYENLPVTTVAAGDSYAGFDTESMTTDPDHIAFSPNGDGDFDAAQPIVGMLRSAAEVTVDVLDENGQVVRQINHRENVAKYLAMDANESRSPISLLSSGTAGDGTWDGTRYDIATGEYVMCDEGQYTLRIRARMPGSDRVETTLLPVKLDLTAPQVHITSAAVDDGMLYLTYTAQDYSGILNTAAVFVNGQEELDFVPGNDAAYNEETGEYSVVLPVETYQDGQMNEIALTCMDYAFNGTTDILYTNARLDAAVMFSNLNNDDSLTVLRDISYSADYDYVAESYVNITDCVAQIRGIASSSVRRLTVNGQEASFDERNGFRLALSVEEPGLITLHVVAYDADGSVVFQADKPALFDVQRPSVMSYVCDKNGEWDNSMLWTSDHTMDGYLLATKYAKDDLVPMMIQVTDESLTRITVSWLTGTVDGETFSDWLMGANAADVDAEVHTQEISLDSRDEEGRMFMSFPFAYKESVFVDDETGEVYDYSAWSQVVRVEAYDAAGHRTLRNALLYDTVYGEKMYNEDGFNDARYSDGTIRGDILDLDPLWSNELGGLSDSRFLITDDMLDENGSLHVKATLDRDANVLIFNGSEYWPEEGSRQVEFDIPIHAGLNLTYVKTLSSMFAVNDFGTQYKLYLYYLPDTEPTALRFDDARIADGAVICTNQETFPITGDVTHLFGNISLKINGDILIYPTNDVNVLGDPITQVFSYGAQLQEGKNVVTVELSDEATGTATTVTFTVVKDTAAPEAPVIAQGGDGKVTLTAAQEDVTLYYSYDGTEWVLYTGPFAPTATPVYAKAVDRAGNESAVSQLAVQVAASQPVQTGDAAPVAVYTALLLTAAAALAAAPMLRRRRVK